MGKTSTEPICACLPDPVPPINDDGFRTPPGRRGLLSRAWRLLSALDAPINRGLGNKYNPLYYTGAITVVLLLLVLLTGIYVLVLYRVGVENAPASVAAMERSPISSLMRSLHRYASDAALISAALHALRMLITNRVGGGAAMGWLSGVILVGFFLIEGITGYFLIWDLQAQVIAREMFRFLDLLPIFAEPMSRTLLSQATMNNLIFFAMLFLHVMLAFGLLVLMWYHVTRVDRPRAFPPRPFIYAMVGILAALSIIWPAKSNPAADLDTLPSILKLDWLYVFPVPIQRALGPVPTWFLLGALFLLTALLPFIWRTRRPRAPEVTLRYCTACRQCYDDCPYNAIQMKPRSDLMPFEEEAWVNPAACARCGICVGSCSSGAMSMSNISTRSFQPLVRQTLNEMPAVDGPRIIVFGCQYSAAGRPEAFRDLDGVAVIPVSCIGMVHPFILGYALRSGADAVLAVGCPEEGGPFRLGNRWEHLRLEGERLPALSEHVDSGRIHTLGAGAAETRLVREKIAFLREEPQKPADTSEDQGVSA